MPHPVLSNIVVVLDHPQDLVNVAGVVRAMKNMGLSRLRLVQPDEFDSRRIEGIAHRSEDVVEGTRLLDTLEEAVEDATWVVGTTARGRTAHRNYRRPRELAPQVVRRAREGTVALVFGREDRGLSNAALDMCQAVAVIPTDPEYSSLNLAQAFLVLGYEVFVEAEGAGVALPEGKRDTSPATQKELEETYRALEAGLEEIDFFKGTRPPEAVMRVLRTLLGRAEPDRQEAGLVRAVGFEIRNYVQRLRERTEAER